MQYSMHYAVTSETCSGLGEQPREHASYKYSSKNILTVQTNQTVTHPSTDCTQCCLTSVIGQELVCSSDLNLYMYKLAMILEIN